MGQGRPGTTGVATLRLGLTLLCVCVCVRVCVEADVFPSAVVVTAPGCQKPWITNASIQANILFGREFDLERFSEVVTGAWVVGT